MGRLRRGTLSDPLCKSVIGRLQESGYRTFMSSELSDFSCTQLSDNSLSDAYKETLIGLLRSGRL